ncbi:GntR family transcriptional regulator [Streptococcus anginosus]|uniref:GntR family transcriptional regulator n=1 Tax=Streptococcus anginosus TaxID=1328 RepID=UPI000E7F3133|nr:GntR family transcriptional regulator [Streptococcus sp.]
MSWTFDNNLPIYLQIMDRIKLQIISNQLQAGEKLPAVRELAAEAGVNPNTIQRALSDLEKEGFVYSQRTSGRFVTDNHDLILKTRQKLSKEEVEKFVNGMIHFGYQKEELPTIIADYIKGV